MKNGENDLEADETFGTAAASGRVAPRRPILDVARRLMMTRGAATTGRIKIRLVHQMFKLTRALFLKCRVSKAAGAEFCSRPKCKIARYGQLG